jgi:hypothetical protein
MQRATNNKSILRILSLALVLLMSVGMLGVGVSAEPASPLKGTSVSLGSELVVNFYAELTDTESAAMTFCVNEDTRTVPVAQARHIEGNLYAFPCTIAAAQMTDTIEATLSDSGNTYQTSTSVRAYADKLFASKQWDKLAANDMMVATLNYGAAAQKYFGYNTENFANTGYEKAATAEIPQVDSSNPVSGSVSGISFYGASLVFKTRIAVRFYFTVKGDIADYNFSIGEKPVYKNGMYYVEVPDINPQDYAENITLTVNDQMAVTYSPMQYISRMYGKTESAELKALVNELYQYHLTAVNYLADPYGNDKDNLVSAQ